MIHGLMVLPGLVYNRNSKAHWSDVTISTRLVATEKSNRKN